jgi:hypothetical protein
MTTLMQDTAHEKRAMSSQVEAVGRELTRYGLVVAPSFDFRPRTNYVWPTSWWPTECPSRRMS